MRIEVEEAACVASGQCVLIEPAVFDQRDEDGMVVLLTDAPGPELYDSVRESAMVCPAAAIHVVEG